MQINWGLRSLIDGFLVLKLAVGVELNRESLFLSERVIKLRTLQFQLRLLRNEPRERDLIRALNLALAV